MEHKPGQPISVDWIEGLAICIAILIVVLVGSLNDFQKERAFVKLNSKVSFDLPQTETRMKLTLMDRRKTVRLKLFVLGNHL